MNEPSGPSRYAAALDYLFARVTGGWKMGLERTTELLSLLGDPHTRVPAFHVAGTNGKGSVISTLEALLRGQGLRVGKYTSPHLIDFRERIAVNGVPMGEAEVVAFIERWTPDVERLGATFFEATTAMAFEHFVRERVDVAVIEVGLGGRLDSTNVITPVAAGVSSIGIDHVQYLGNTLEEIAREKAGIFKRGVPAVIGESDPKLRAFLVQLAREAGADPVRAVADEWALTDISVSLEGTRFTLRTANGTRQLRTPLIGRHQAMNAATALSMLESAGAPYAAAAADPSEALARVRIAGRFQSVGSIIFDVAHNPAGCAVLCETLQAVKPRRPLTCLMTALRDKDWQAMMTTLAPLVDRFVLASPPSVPADRAWTLAEALAFANGRGWNATAEPDFDRALADARAGSGTTLITGSFHTVGDAMARLQVSPLVA
ncbi:MAG: bifunctional folylpolyglutamate synthase/dihydrofolate synthase [Gemmatimonadaceae bacterium]|nr:bifunctional folylpolyglutamate synthase/dihydrofolate synthase [Gemmatimonadaceae bacterium]